MTIIRSEDNFMTEHAELDDDVEMLPGVTVGHLRAMLVRPARDPEGSRFVPSVAYSDDAGDVAQMALYARSDPTEQAPIVVFAHGGGFLSGHHYTAVRYLHPLAARGYVAATITYRLANEAPWPAALEDAKCAVRWLRHHARELGGDPDRIVMAGDSAGGYLAAMTALTPGEYEGDGGCNEVSSEIQGAVLFYPPVDMESVAELGMTQDMEHLYGYFGDDLANASPVNRVHGACPPILTLTGENDPITTVGDISTFHQALASAGVPERLEVFPKASHGFDIVPSLYERCLARLTDFVEETVGPPRRTG